MLRKPTEMDEQQGNVIDGTARAPDWRRSESRKDGDASELRADAPKSIAASLLVPADMVSGPLSTGAGDDNAEIAPSGHPAVADSPTDATSHRNLFLSPGAAAEQAEKRSPRKPILARLVRLIDDQASRVTRFRLPAKRLPFGLHHRLPRTLPARPLALALGLASLVVVAVIATQSGTSPAPTLRATGGRASAANDRAAEALLSDAATALGFERANHPGGSTRARTLRKQRAPNSRPKPRNPIGTTAAPIVAARYTPPPSTAGATSGPASSGGGSGSTVTPAAPSSPAASTSSGSGGHTSAFGSSGALGPGSSPNG